MHLFVSLEDVVVVSTLSGMKAPSLSSLTQNHDFQGLESYAK